MAIHNSLMTRKVSDNGKQLPGVGAMNRHLLVLVICLLPGCTGIPENIEPVSGFDINRYVGKWYEIARLPHSFEEGLENITASYSPRKDGGIKVINKGFGVAANSWKTAEGRAYFVGRTNVGHLKVSFFGPFYGSYIVFGLDRNNYQYAYVTSYNREYLWLLSRTPAVSEKIRQDFIRTSQSLGFNTGKIIFVRHTDTVPQGSR